MSSAAAASAKKRKIKSVNVKLYRHADTIVIKRAKFEKGDICTVCLSELTYENPIAITTTKCNHVFHRVCLLNWILTNNIHTCPICRGPVGTHRAPERQD